MLGCGVLLRHLRQPAAAVVAAGALLLTLFAARVDPAAIPAASLLLALLPFYLAFAAAALDQWMDAFVRAWGRIVRPVHLVATTAVVLLLVLGRPTLTLIADLDAIQTSEQDQAETDMARFIARW